MKTKNRLKWFAIPSQELVREIALLKDEELDSLPFGSVCLARDGLILAYSDGRTGFSGLSRPDVLGRDFFHAIAPSARTPEFYGRFQSGALQGNLDITFPFTFRFPVGWRAAKVRMVSDPGTGLVWILLEPRAQIGSFHAPVRCSTTGRLERKAS